MSIFKRISYDHVLIYLLILFKMGFGFIEQWNSITAPLLMVLLALSCILRHKSVNNKAFLVAFLLFALMNVTYFVTGFPEPIQYVIMVTQFITAILFASVMDYHVFLRKFSEVILAVSFVSIIAWILKLGNFPFSSIAPAITNSSGAVCRFLGLAFVTEYFSSGMSRIYGLAWEPGAFQILIIISMLYQMYNIDSEKHRFITRNRCIYFFALVLTFSTTGFLALFCLFTLFVLRGGKNKNLNVLFFLLILVGCYYLFTDGNEIYDQVFGKKIDEMNAYEMRSGGRGTASVRMDSVIFPLLALLRSPFVGIGDSGFEGISMIIGHDMFTCTPINIFVKYGPLYGIVCVVGILGLLRLKTKKLLESIVLLITIIISVFSESVGFNSIFTLLVLYGFIERKKHKQKY